MFWGFIAVVIRRAEQRVVEYRSKTHKQLQLPVGTVPRSLSSPFPLTFRSFTDASPESCSHRTNPRAIGTGAHLLPKKQPPAKFQVSSPSGLGDFAMILRKREGYWDGRFHFEPWSDDKDGTLACALSKLPHHTSGRTLGHCVACNGRHTRRIFWRIGFRAWSPPTPKPYRYAAEAV
ncbi:hypothetical protein AVEN_148260-1 [Araneus ventricosus]|uniref:Uncharacterized protein n=1 Tax=Araneus ventricosus TaxID=182803 RepID=A0A4Y2TST0_ARAVE|nr:hypothetical protein AVEN_148260-1 [Araneus ventricosus]